MDLNGYVTRNNHFHRAHPGVRMSYTLVNNEDTQVAPSANEYQPDRHNNSIENNNIIRNDDGDIQMEDQNIEACKFTPSFFITVIVVYLPMLLFIYR
jgi:hypothetical protein